MWLSFSTQSKLGNNLFLAAAEPTPTPSPTPGVLGVGLYGYFVYTLVLDFDV
jgi:hypothetical protein